ncbi:MAG: ATP-binding protein, partial [Saprospiraceae bacterium]
SELQAMLASTIEEKNAEIIITNPLPSVFANRSSIVLLFQNLLENAIKYNQSDVPTVKISSQKQVGSFSIVIEDNGIGISQEYHDEIFVMFARLHSQQTYEGTGLGLATCKKIVDQLNGTISLSSEINKGSVFTINLPLQ